MCIIYQPRLDHCLYMHQDTASGAGETTKLAMKVNRQRENETTSEGPATVAEKSKVQDAN